MIFPCSQDLIVNLAEKIGKMEKVLQHLIDLHGTSLNSSVTEESLDSSEGSTTLETRMQRISATNVYVFALQLIDLLFSKEEMACSLLFKSKKSSKPGLNKQRVEQLLKLVEKRYGDKWNIKILTAKANQKCRDSKEIKGEHCLQINDTKSDEESQLKGDSQTNDAGQSNGEHQLKED